MLIQKHFLDQLFWGVPLKDSSCMVSEDWLMVSKIQGKVTEFDLFYPGGWQPCGPVDLKFLRFLNFRGEMVIFQLLDQNSKRFAFVCNAFSYCLFVNDC